MRLIGRVRIISFRSISALVLSLACLAIFGNAQAGPYDQGAAQFIRLMEKQAAGSITTAVGVNVARGLGVMNPAVALGTTALALYMMACTPGQSDSQCMTLGGLKVGLKPGGVGEDRPLQQYTSAPTSTTYPVTTVHQFCRFPSNNDCVYGGGAIADLAASWGATYGEQRCQSGGGSTWHYQSMFDNSGADGTWWVVCWNGTSQLGLQSANQLGDVVHCNTGDTLNGSTCSTPPVCPQGTTLTNGVCVGQVITADGVNRFKAVSAQWEAPFPDVDNPTQPASAPANPLTYTGIDAFGNKQRITLVPRADGGIDVEILTEYVAGGQTVTQFNRATVNSDGTINEKVDTKTGTITQQGAPLTTTPPNPGTTPSPVVVNIPPLELPTDYNREPTQQSIDSTLKSGVKILEAGTPATGDFASADAAADAAKAAAEALAATATDANTKDTSWGFALTLPSGCTNPPGIVVPNWHLNWVPDLCQFSDRIHAVTGFLWVVLTLGACLSMVRSAVSGGA